MANDTPLIHNNDLLPKYGNSSEVGNRYFGGTYLKDHPYIKGYFQVFFELPPAIFGGADVAPATLGNILTSTCEAFTPHGDRTLNKVDITGQGGVSSSFVSGQTITRDISLTFKETWDAPVWRILRQWTASIINPYTGVSDVLTDFVGNEYKGRAMVIETKPINTSVPGKSPQDLRSSIIRIYYYDGVFPTTDISSVFDSSIQDNSNVTLNIPFSFDGYPLDHTNEQTLDRAVQYIKDKDLYKSSMSYYSALYRSEHNSGGTASSTDLTNFSNSIPNS
jgi:hypothetical protein